MTSKDHHEQEKSAAVSDIEKQTHVDAESFTPERHAIIVIGASAGGVEVLREILPRLPQDIPAALFITVHFPPDAESLLPRILDRRSALHVKAATDAEAIRPGHVYVAPPDRHLLVGRRLIRVVRGPTENGNRPAIDPMFRSAAVSHRSRVIGVVLTGNLDDGTAGLLAIKRRGGMAVTQDPADAMFPSMPSIAARDVAPDEVAPVRAMPELLDRLAREPVTPTEGAAMDDANSETELSKFDLDAIERSHEHPGDPSSFSCPDCGGVLWRIRDGDLVRFRCRVGHGWTGDGLSSEQEVALETALWTALVRRLLLEGRLPGGPPQSAAGGEEIERAVPHGAEAATETDAETPIGTASAR